MAERIGTMFVDIEGNTSGLNRAIAGAQLKATAAFNKVGAAASGMITGGLIAGVSAVVVGLAAGVPAAIRFEEAFAGVKKTLDATEGQFARLSDELVDMSRNLPMTSTELAKIAQVAGQLGIAAEDVGQFTEVIAKLGGATDLTGEQGATSMARFMKVINQPIENTEAFASVLVALGNNMAATENEILELAKNFGALGTQVGLGGEEILAFSAAMREMGQPAAAGATALNKLFTNLNSALLGDGGLSSFAEIAGMSMLEFQELAESSMAAAAAAVLEGLNDMGDAEKSQIAALQEVGLARDRVSRALITLAANEQGLAKAREIANQELFEQAALEREFLIRQDTVAGQMDILKSKFHAFAQTLGKALLPVIRGLVKFLGNVLDGFTFFIGAVTTASDKVKVFMTAIGVRGLFSVLKKVGNVIKALVARFKGLGDITEEAAKKLGFFSKFVQKIGLGKIVGAFSGVGTFLAGFSFLGKMQQDIDAFGGSVEDLTNKFNILKQSGDGIAELTEQELKAMVDGLQDGDIKDTLLDQIASGELTTEDVNRLHEQGKIIGEEFTQALKDQLGVGRQGGAMGFDLPALTKVREQMEASGQTNNDIFKTTVALTDALIDNGGKHNEITREIESQLIAQLALNDALQGSETITDKVRNLLIDNADAIGKTPAEIRAATREMDGLEAMAKAFAGDIEGLPSLVDKLFPPEVDPIQQAMANLKEDLGILEEMVNATFDPAKSEFELEFAKLDLTEAQEEVVDLQSEQVDLQKELVANAEELQELKNSEVLDEEEILKIAEKRAEIAELENKHATEAAMTMEEQAKQQDMIVEALEIEERLRNGMALSANQQLRREKLRKDRRRVELAAAQGSLEFADLELAAIDENIKAIEDKAVTQEDADKLRRDAAEIAQNAEKRRADELNKILTLKGQILDTQEKASARRQKEIETVEKRRIEINERLAELPRDIAEAHFDILKAEQQVVDKTIEMKKAFIELSTVSQQEMANLAASIGIPATMIGNLLGLVEENEGKSNSLINGLIGGATNKANQIMSMGGGLSAFHGGGAFKGGQNLLVGELGPELVKTFPSGGGMVTALGGGRGGMQNTINLNITGLPSDPIATRRIVQNISRELGKLEREGRSGVVR